jgi:hypothetical protein
MSAQSLLIQNLLRILTPEEIGDIATKHNGGRFLSLNDLVNERIDKKIYRDFSTQDYMEEFHEKSKGAKILPFKKSGEESTDGASEKNFTDQDGAEGVAHQSLTEAGEAHLSRRNANSEDPPAQNEIHDDGENMSSFILIEKARLKRSQKMLKQREIIDLYQKNSNVDVEQIRGSNTNLEQSSEAGVLVNKKQY